MLEEPYPGARYTVTDCHDYLKEARTPSRLKDPYSRFVGRKVRKYFEVNNLKHRHRLQAVEGVVERYSNGKSLFRIKTKVSFVLGMTLTAAMRTGRIWI